MGYALLTSLGAMLGSGISAWFAVQLALRRFQEEKLWERKSEAYTKLVAALHTVKEHMIRAEECITFSGHESYESLIEDYQGWVGRFDEAEEELSKFKDVGALILPDSVVAAVAQYHKEKNVASSRRDMDNVSIIFDAADRCRQEVIRIAKKDLKSVGGKFSELLSLVISKCPTSAPR